MIENFEQRDTPPTTEVPSGKKNADEARVQDHEPGGGVEGANESMNVKDRVAWSIDGRNQAAHEEIHHTLRRGRDSSDAVVIVSREFSQAITASRGTGFRGDGTPREPFVITNTGVRRFTPREHERLQGLKDDHTLVEYLGKPATDSPRFKAIGNSIAVPVMQWIGRRIAAAFMMNDRPRPIPKFTRPVPKPRDWIRRRRPGQTCNNPALPEPHK